jgi:hypothetical protein
MADTDRQWSKEAVYDELVSPLMARIIGICKEHVIPLVAEFQYAVDEEGPCYCTTVVPFDHQSDHMTELENLVRPRSSVCLAETVQAMPDGSQRITISVVR